MNGKNKVLNMQGRSLSRLDDKICELNQIEFAKLNQNLLQSIPEIIQVIKNKNNNHLQLY